MQAGTRTYAVPTQRRFGSLGASAPTHLPDGRPQGCAVLLALQSFRWV